MVGIIFECAVATFPLTSGKAARKNSLAISKRSTERAISGLKRLLPIIEQQRLRDVSEADTVTLVKDIMSEVFGFDKYTELTSEHAIRGTYCDLAVRIVGEKSALADKLTAGIKAIGLVEIKSAGTTLDDRHVKQAIDYAANDGVVWVVLTNASDWRLYEVLFQKPIDKRLIAQVDLSKIELKGEDCVDCLAPFMREGFVKGVQVELRDRQDATSRYLLSALILNNDNVISAIRRELRRIVDVLVGDDEIVKVLSTDVIKRETMDGPEADAAVRKVNRIGARVLRGKMVPQADGNAADNTASGDGSHKPPCEGSPSTKQASLE
jgi:hypothetical protein